MASFVSEPSFSRVVIFPDEKDSDCEDQDVFADENVFEIEEKQEGKNNRVHDLNEWKKKSGIFSACQRRGCDPLRKFCGLTTCDKCRARRDTEFKKLCIVWKKDEIFDILLDYAYFRAISVFDEAAEFRFSKENPTHPYFVSYKRVRQFNNTLLESVCQVGQVSPKVKATIMNHSEMCVTVSLRNIPCEMCGDGFADSMAKRTFVLTGRRYRSSDFKFVNNSSKSKSTLSHEEIQAVHAQNENLTAAEIINAIEPYIFRNLVKFFMKIYNKWERLPCTYRLSHFSPILQTLFDQWKCSVVGENIDSAISARNEADFNLAREPS